MAYAYGEQTWTTRRLVGLFAAIAINVGLILGLASGLSFRLPVFTPHNVEVVTVDTPPVKLDEPPPPPPQVETAPPEPLDIPMPVIDLPPEPQPQDAIVAETKPAPAAPRPLPANRELQVDPRHPLSPPVYPAASRRASEQGTVLLMIYVLADGRVGDAKVARSSGYPRLDQAALDAARKNWHFQPAEQAGSAVAAWGQYAVKFQLTS
jgi:protein TonB